MIDNVGDRKIDIQNCTEKNPHKHRDKVLERRERGGGGGM